MLKRIRKRAKLLGFTSCVPSIKVIVLPSGLNTPSPANHKPLKTQSDIYELYYHKSNITRVIGGICYTCVSNSDEQDEQIDTFTEVNEYGIVFRQERLRCYGDDNNEIDHDAFVYSIRETLEDASRFYDECSCPDVCIRVHIKNVFQKTLMNDRERKLVFQSQRALCLEPNIKASTERPNANLHERDQRKDIIFELIEQLIWAFNVPINLENVKDTVKSSIHY